MPFRNLGMAAGFYRAVNATVAGTSEIDGASYDLQASYGGPFAGIAFIASLGTVTDTNVTTLKVQGSSDNATWTDIATSGQVNNPTGDSNKLLVVDIFRPQYRYARPVLTRLTANAVVDSVVGIAYLAHSTPVTTQDATVSTASASHAMSAASPVNVVAYGAGGTA